MRRIGLNDHQLRQLTSTSQKPPKVRIYQKDELTLLEKQNKIKDLKDINANHAPANYLFHKTLEFVVFYNLKFSLSGFPKIYGAIKINKDLHVQLEWCGGSVPLPQSFVKGKDPKLTNVSMLDNFHSYLQSLQDSFNTFIEEMKSRQEYKAKGRTSYSL